MKTGDSLAFRSQSACSSHEVVQRSIQSLGSHWRTHIVAGQQLLGSERTACEILSRLSHTYCYCEESPFTTLWMLTVYTTPRPFLSKLGCS